MSTLKKSESEFHHGDLRAALVMAGLKHVQKHGLNSLGLRHLEHLKAAVAKASREVLGAMMLDALNSAPKTQTTRGAISRFLAIGGAYIDFGIKESNLYEIAFICFDSPDLEPDSPSPWELLLDSLNELNEFGCLSDKNLKTAPTIAWSMVHGFAGLAAQGATGNSGETLASKKVVLQSALKCLEIK
jgi:hypothetical protein